MKKFLLKMLEIYHGIPFKLQRWMTNDEAKSIEKNFSSLCDCVDKGGAYYVSYRIRPQTTDTANESIDISDNSRIGIVIQGPYFHGFTDESIRLYRKYYSNAIIVFSTWKGLPKEAEEVLKALDVIVVESEEPICSGRLNINFQIINSAAGVEAAIENGAEYICTAADSKTCTTDAASFTAGEDLTVYVGLDTRVTSEPAWLQGWTRTEDTVVNSNQVAFRIYKKDVSKGDTVVLGANGQSSGCVFYTAFVTLQGVSPLLGDVDADGDVDAADAKLLRDYLVRRTASLPDAQAADLNGDGILNAADLAILKSMLLD